MIRTLLFAYGSLLTGSGLPRVDDLLAAHADDLGAAVMRGRLYLMTGYPGAVPSCHAGEWISGRVFRVRDFSRLIRRLDAYEDYFPARPAASEFVRARSVAMLRATGRRVPVWVYLYNRRVNGRRRLYDGDYAAWIRAAAGTPFPGGRGHSMRRRRGS